MEALKLSSKTVIEAAEAIYKVHNDKYGTLQTEYEMLKVAYEKAIEDCKIAAFHHNQETLLKLKTEIGGFGINLNLKTKIDTSHIGNNGAAGAAGSTPLPDGS